ncbi:MAG: NUDIX domain-containing protein [Actinomycetota bacterium]|nr:NUDIX domain-containing protein [Actinomycetota bacterium]
MASRDTDPGTSGGEPEVPTANAWVDCVCGERHWGRYGAAGLLLIWRSPDGQPEVLLQHRAAWTHQGGTWALPGGARGHDETAEQAALREAHEEAALDPAGVRTGELVVTDHGTWSYTYVFAQVQTPARPEVSPADPETEALAWVRVDDVAAYPLHPLFAEAWPKLKDRLLQGVTDS